MPSHNKLAIPLILIETHSPLLLLNLPLILLLPLTDTGMVTGPGLLTLTKPGGGLIPIGDPGKVAAQGAYGPDLLKELLLPGPVLMLLLEHLLEFVLLLLEEVDRHAALAQHLLGELDGLGGVAPWVART